MNWFIDFSANSLKFLKRNNFKEDFVVSKVESAIKMFRGENVSIDIKKLKGDWEGFYRIRSGKLRIIVEFQFDQNRAYIEEIDWRGNVYK
ncbi:type II toxin-antitoxin system RelE/ParE family toxin [Patescibacteria group bacterium]|nr:type II toxin-antitoxin system RelE/ParE family toxin [Patescibacteria group bacterium]